MFDFPLYALDVMFANIGVLKIVKCALCRKSNTSNNNKLIASVQDFLKLDKSFGSYHFGYC